MKRLIILTTLLVVGLVTTACPKNPDISKLPPASQAEYKRTQIKKVVNDTIDAAIAANHAGKLPNSITQAVLTTDWQLIDILDSPAPDALSRAKVIVANAKQALPSAISPEVAAYNALIVGWLNQIEQVLNAQ